MGSIGHVITLPQHTPVPGILNPGLPVEENAFNPVVLRFKNESVLPPGWLQMAGSLQLLPTRSRVESVLAVDQRH